MRKDLFALSILIAAMDAAHPEAVAAAQPANALGVSPSAMWPGKFGDPRITLALIQSNLERTAAGKPRWSEPEGNPDRRLENIVDAYGAYLRRDFVAMAAVLTDVSAAAVGRNARAQYYAGIDAASGSPTPLVRLILGLRKVDSVLYLEALEATGSAPNPTDLESRFDRYGSTFAENPVNNSWLRLPCRTVVGRASEFAQAAAELGKLVGPLLACPSAESDYAKLESLAARPEQFQPAPPRPPARL